MSDTAIADTQKNNDTDDEFGIFEENIPASKSQSSPEAIVDLLASGATDASKQYITFTINREEYGTPILSVQEIRGWMKTTPLPNTPEYVIGVTNLRGNVVPVFDMRARFRGELTQITDRHVVIMVDINNRTIGLLVDAISDILTIDESQVQPPPDASMTVEAQYLDGLVPYDGRMVALINIKKLFHTDVIENINRDIG
jgi:purine-binding chemotaxis protein CheW